MKHTYTILIIILVSSSISGRWAFHFHKKIMPQEMMIAQRQNRYFFCREHVPLFTQLLFSWNAVRPARGHLEFSVQVRNAQTGRWGSWHRMMTWGRKHQSSHMTPSDGFAKYEHVRLETEKGRLADAFCIKVVGVRGALLTGLRALSVTTVNMRAFSPESAKSIAYLPSVYIPHVPKISQMALDHRDNGRICSPTSCTMLMRYLTGTAIDPLKFAHFSYDKGLDAYGSWPFNMASAFEFCHGKYWFFNTRLDSFVDLHKQLMRGVPVVASIRGTLPGAPQPYPNGHLLVVVGWDRATKHVICHDPAVATHYETERQYRLKDFIKVWEQSRRLVYLASPIR